MHIAHNCDSVSFKANGKATKQVVCRYTWCVLLVFLSNPLKSFNLCKRPQNASSSYHSFLFTNTMHLSQPFFSELLCILLSRIPTFMCICILHCNNTIASPIHILSHLCQLTKFHLVENTKTMKQKYIVQRLRK